MQVAVSKDGFSSHFFSFYPSQRSYHDYDHSVLSLDDFLNSKSDDRKCRVDMISKIITFCFQSGWLNDEYVNQFMILFHWMIKKATLNYTQKISLQLYGMVYHLVKCITDDTNNYVYNDKKEFKYQLPIKYTKNQSAADVQVNNNSTVNPTKVGILRVEYSIPDLTHITLCYTEILVCF